MKACLRHPRTWLVPSLMLLIPVGLLATGIARGAAPAQSQPATSAPAAAIPAHVILANFPANVAAQVPKGKTIVVEGWLHGNYSTPTPTGKTVYVTLVGLSQPGNDYSHITCVMEGRAAGQAMTMGPGKYLRVTGIVGDIDPKTKRLTLEKCSQIGQIKIPESHDPLIGAWRGVVEDCPRVTLDVRFTADHKASVIFNSQDPERPVAAAWAKSETDTEKQRQILLTLNGAKEAARVEVYRANQRQVAGLTIPYENLVLPAHPGFPVFIQPDGLTLYRAHGEVAMPKVESPKDAALKWLRANLSFNNPQRILNEVTQMMASSDRSGGQFSLLIGADLLKKKHAARLDAVNGSLFTFEYTDDQDARSGMRQPAIRSSSIMGQGAVQLKPEVIVESVEFEQKGAISKSKNAKIKVTLRGIHLRTSEDYTLLLETCRGSVSHALEHGPELDATTVEMECPQQILNGDSFANPLALYFSVYRYDKGFGRSRISDTKAVLMNIDP